MKFYVELAIAAVLLLLVYDKPTELTELSNTIVGKMILIVIVGCVAKMRGMGAGLMAALVMLILLHDGREGFKEGADSKTSAKKKKQDKKGKKDTKTSILGELENRAKSISSKDKKKDDKKDHDKKDHDKKDHDKKDHDKKEKKETFSVSDVRVTEGMRNMESYSNTIAAAKFQNGYTGNRDYFNGFI
jgi:hypothetical protein